MWCSRARWWGSCAATGAVIRSFDGQPGDANGYAIADAGDTNRDGYHDIVSGAPRQTPDAPGHAYLYSGRDGSLLHAFTGEATPDSFGAAVSSAGDVNRDRRPDIAIGSYQSDDGAPDAGKIEIYSGATGAKLRTITSTTAGENLGFDAVGVGDVNRDHRPDLLASAAEGDTVYLIAGTPASMSPTRTTGRARPLTITPAD